MLLSLSLSLSGHLACDAYAFKCVAPGGSARCRRAVHAAAVGLALKLHFSQDLGVCLAFPSLSAYFSLSFLTLLSLSPLFLPLSLYEKY